MEALSIALLIFTTITGFVFSILILLKFSESYENRIQNIFFWFWICIPILILITWNNGKPSFFASQANFYLLNVLLLSTSLLSAFGANVVKKVLENSMKVKKSIQYLLRFILILYGSICISIFLSVIESSAYMTGIVEYKANPQLEKVLSADTLERISEIKQKTSRCNAFLADLQKLKEKEFVVRKKNAFTYFTGKHRLDINEDHNFDLEYVISGGDKYPIIHFIIYYPKKKAKDKYIHVLKVGGMKLKLINKDTIEHSLQKELLELGKNEYIIKEKPLSLITMAAANILDELGIKSYRYIGIGVNAKRLDTVLHWLTILISGFLFYEFGKSWN